MPVPRAKVWPLPPPSLVDQSPNIRPGLPPSFLSGGRRTQISLPPPPQPSARRKERFLPLNAGKGWLATFGAARMPLRVPPTGSSRHWSFTVSIRVKRPARAPKHGTVSSMSLSGAPRLRRLRYSPGLVALITRYIATTWWTRPVIPAWVRAVRARRFCARLGRAAARDCGIILIAGLPALPSPHPRPRSVWSNASRLAQFPSLVLPPERCWAVFQPRCQWLDFWRPPTGRSPEAPCFKKPTDGALFTSETIEN